MFARSTTLLALSAVLAFGTSLSLAQDDGKISLDVQDSTVAVIAQMIAAGGGFEVSVAPGVADKPVPRFTVDGISAVEALKMLCLMTGLEVKEAEGAYEIVATGAPPEPGTDTDAGQETEPEQPAAEPLVLDDMEGDPGARWADNSGKNPVDLVADAEIVKVGQTSGKWDPDVAARYIFTTRMPNDWTGYDSIAMWVHSERATDAAMAIVLDSENPETEGKDYYRYLLNIDWEGWRELRLYEGSFQRAREPIGFSKIEVFRFAFEGWPGMVEYVPGTVLRFDDIRAVPAAPAGDKLVIFHADTDCGIWGSGRGALGCVKEPTKTGGRVTEWVSTIAQTSIWNIAAPTDWSAYEYLNMWVYCQEASEAEILFWVESDNPDTEGQDRYQIKIPLDWEGWKLLSFHYEDLRVVREPLGWDQINILRFRSGGYELKQGDGTALYFDDMWLSKQPPEEAEEEG